MMFMASRNTGATGSAMPAAPAHVFASDNVAGAHPLVIESLVRANAGHALAYGNDEHTRRAEGMFNELFDRDVRTLFVYGGTGANVLALASVLAQAECVVCTNWSHIHMDETGAPERVLGAKLLDLPSDDAKLTPEQVRAAAAARGNPHHAQPGVVSLTQPTELGTLYSPAEVRAICDAAHEHGMLVHMDAARVGNATAALGASRASLRSFTVDAGVDVLSFGGTKAGVVFGEAVVWFDPRRATRAEYLRKNVTQLHSKMRYISAQYEALLTDDLFIRLGAQANAAARALYDATRHHASLRLTSPPAVNSLFPTLADPAKTRLQEWSFFWDWDLSAHQVRWMTAWDVTPDDVAAFAAGVDAVLTRQDSRTGSN
jgi:threonine aldolase